MSQEKKLNTFHMRRLSRILQIKGQDQVPDAEVLDEANIGSLHTILSEKHLRWLGHVRRMDTDRSPKNLLNGELALGQRKTRLPKLQYKDALKKDLKNTFINPDIGEYSRQSPSQEARSQAGHSLTKGSSH